MTREHTQHPTPGSDDAQEDIRAILRRPIVFAAISGAVVLSAFGLLIQVGKFVAAPLILGVPSIFMFLICLSQVISFSPAALARLKSSAEQVGGRYTPWKAGEGGFTAVPFTDGIERNRFGVLNYTEQGLHIEIGHLLVEVNSRNMLSIRKMNAYAVVQLPKRMPDMVLDFGHLSRFLGIRMVPAMWHRSQRVDIGGGRGFRLFVADGGEQLARSFFTPETVNLFKHVGRFYDVEIKGRDLYLFTKRSIASGSDRRWQRQRTLIGDLVTSLAGSGVWELVPRRRRARRPTVGPLRMDVKRGVTIFTSVVFAIIVVLSALALYARDQGLLNM